MTPPLQPIVSDYFTAQEAATLESRTLSVPIDEPGVPAHMIGLFCCCGIGSRFRVLV